MPTTLHTFSFTLPTSLRMSRTEPAAGAEIVITLSFRLYMARCTEIPRYGCRGNRHGMTLECEDTEHRPPPSLHGANGAVQSPSSRILICLAQSTQRAQRRFVDCCGPNNACPCATHFRLYFTLPTSLFRLPTPVSTNDKIALEDIFFIMSVCQ